MGKEVIDSLLRAVSVREMEKLLFQLIEIESHSDTPEQEGPLADTVVRYFEQYGITCQKQEVLPNRYNVIARIPGSGSGPSLLLNGHTDTVPPYGMVRAFSPFIKDGKIYGRGSVDMKGALAAMMAVMVAFQQTGIRLRGDLIFAATVGEETYSPGANALISQGKIADYAIVGEPTEMRIGTAHKGVAWYEAVFDGVSVHGSVPDQGINAIYRASQWIEYIQKYYIPELRTRIDPLLGSATLNIGTIEGGTRPVIVPNLCTVRFERRLIPGETAESALVELQRTLMDVQLVYPDFRGNIRIMNNFHGVPHGPLYTNPSSLILSVLKEAYEAQFHQQAELVGLQFWTDGALLNLSGASVVVCGPGNIEQAHSDHEYIEREQLYHAFQIYVRAAYALCAE
jgi:acetylornithine deacetylase/succinyl-diaminopimelate desuccinylase family protein